MWVTMSFGLVKPGQSFRNLVGIQREFFRTLPHADSGKTNAVMLAEKDWYRSTFDEGTMVLAWEPDPLPIVPKYVPVTIQIETFSQGTHDELYGLLCRRYSKLKPEYAEGTNHVDEPVDHSFDGNDVKYDIVFKTVSREDHTSIVEILSCRRDIRFKTSNFNAKIRVSYPFNFQMRAREFLEQRLRLSVYQFGGSEMIDAECEANSFEDFNHAIIQIDRSGFFRFRASQNTR
jgi:hypothetical protein